MEKQIKKDVHIYIEISMAKIIEDIAIKSNSSLSDTYSKLLKYGIEYDDLSKKVDLLNNLLNKIDSTNHYNKKLLQQIYSDLNLIQRDPKTSTNLYNFDKNYRKGKKTLNG